MEQMNKWVSVWGNAVSVAENRPEQDFGDHLHPSASGYARMAMEIPAELLK